MRRLFAIMARAAGTRSALLTQALRVSAAASILQALVYAALIPTVVSALEGDGPAAWRWAVLAAGLLVAEESLRVAELRMAYARLPDVSEAMRLRLGHQMRRVHPAHLATIRAGEAADLLTASVLTAAMGVGHLAAQFMQMVLVPAAFIVVLAAIDVRLVILPLVVAPVIVLLLRRVQADWSRGAAVAQEADAAGAARVVEHLHGLAVFKATGRIGDRADRLTSAVHAQSHAHRQQYTGANRAILLSSSTLHVVVNGVIAIAAALAASGDLAPALAVGVAVAIIRFTEPLNTATSLTGLFEQTEAALDRIQAILDAPSSDVVTAPSLPTGFALSIMDVSFTHPGSARATIAGVRLAVPPGTFVAVVGTSGSGKTTLLRLLLRWADVDRGVIRLGGTDIRHIAPDVLRSHITAVDQDVLLLRGSILDNVRLGSPDADIDAVAQVALRVGLDRVVAEMPAGWDTQVGDLGQFLSGGQRQRVALARAMLSPARVLLLDEPTSGLDAPTEQQVIASLLASLPDRSIVMVTHRLWTAIGADQIVVIERGRVVQQGSHLALLATPGPYADLWSSQAELRPI